MQLNINGKSCLAVDCAGIDGLFFIRMWQPFKVLVITFKSLYSLSPQYLKNRTSPHAPSWHLRSSEETLLSVPQPALEEALHGATVQHCSFLLWSILAHPCSHKTKLKINNEIIAWNKSDFYYTNESSYFYEVKWFALCCYRECKYSYLSNNWIALHRKGFFNALYLVESIDSIFKISSGTNLAVCILFNINKVILEEK